MSEHVRVDDKFGRNVVPLSGAVAPPSIYIADTFSGPENTRTKHRTPEGTGSGSRPKST
jgi:hypothetical protein